MKKLEPLPARVLTRQEGAVGAEREGLALLEGEAVLLQVALPVLLLVLLGLELGLAVALGLGEPGHMSTLTVCLRESVR